MSLYVYVQPLFSRAGTIQCEDTNQENTVTGFFFLFART